MSNYSIFIGVLLTLLGALLLFYLKHFFRPRANLWYTVLRRYSFGELNLKNEKGSHVTMLCASSLVLHNLGNKPAKEIRLNIPGKIVALQITPNCKHDTPTDKNPTCTIESIPPKQSIQITLLSDSFFAMTNEVTCSNCKGNEFTPISESSAFPKLPKPRLFHDRMGMDPVMFFFLAVFAMGGVLFITVAMKIARYITQS